MKEDKKKDDKHALVIVVGTGGPKKPEKTADPSMKKAWAFLKNDEYHPNKPAGYENMSEDEQIAIAAANAPRAPPKLSTAQEYHRERDRKELGLGRDADSSLPKEGALTGTLDNKTGTPRTINPQRTQVPSGQIEAKRNIARNPTNEIEYQRE